MSERESSLFTGLVMMLGQSALLHMGKLVNPSTGKAEVHLDYAQESIDMLDMLEARTKGNLDPQEARLLKTTLSSLKLNYVETMQQKAAPAAPAPEAATPPPAAPPEDAKGEESESKVKFHKSFG